MTWALLSFVLFVAGLLALLGLSLRQPSKAAHSDPASDLSGGSLLRHAVYFPQVRQSLSEADLAFVASHGSEKLASRVRSERRRVALGYLRALQEDFRSLLNVGKVLAALSPEVAAEEESERFWLAVRFECGYQMTRAFLLLGGLPLSQLHRMTQMVGTLGARLEAAMVGLGEQAARAVEFASGAGVNGSRLDLS